MAKIEIPDEIITRALQLNIDAVGRVAFPDDTEIPDELSATDLCMALRNNRIDHH